MTLTTRQKIGIGLEVAILCVVAILFGFIWARAPHIVRISSLFNNFLIVSVLVAYGIVLIIRHPKSSK